MEGGKRSRKETSKLACVARKVYKTEGGKKFQMKKTQQSKGPIAGISLMYLKTKKVSVAKTI